MSTVVMNPATRSARARKTLQARKENVWAAQGRGSVGSLAPRGS